MTNDIKLVHIETAVDGETFQEAKCQFFGKTQTLKVINPYGLASRLPDDSFGIAFSPNGYDGDVFVIGARPDLRRLDLKEGEIVVGNFVSGATIRFRETGEIVIVPGDNTGQVRIVGNLQVNKVITTLDDIVSPSVSGYDKHKHSGVESGPDNTGNPF